jgi:hypothetical protein
MARDNYLFTSESVSEGHPDKVCDRISDAVLDAFLAEEPEARVACETFATTGMVVIGGEVGLSDQDKLKNYMGRIAEIARDCIKDIGYEQDKFHWNTCHVLNFLHEQSAHIAQGVDAAEGKDEGAGDQGIMFGYATDETPELMPAPIQYAHAILRRLAEVRKSGKEPTLGPDAKSQLTVRYEDGKPVGVTSIVLSTQHLDEDMTSDDVRADRRALHPRGAARGLDHRRDRMVGEPDRHLRHRRPGRRCGPDGPQDHRRHLWRRRAPWRRRVFRQGPDQGGPLGGLCRALPGQERRRRRPRRALHHPAVLCHRRGRAAVDLCRHPRHRGGPER